MLNEVATNDAEAITRVPTNGTAFGDARGDDRVLHMRRSVRL
jgi:hypothetical protein